ncbi:MAG TPA: alpha/beta fold hydrolase [Xanthomonadales bacterium]|nr:alpha/beta fold hydrolase [Xanthomonadales bacterium]
MRFVVLAFLLACGGSSSTTGDAAGDTGPDAPPPVPAGCITDVSSGDHVYTCGGLAVDARIPPACQAPGCGLVLVLHGDTGNGLLMDAHVRMRALGEQHGFVVVAPTGPPFGQGLPGSTWRQANDATLVQIVRDFASVFRVDMKNIHVTGFSRGAFVTWRLICDHSELFASAAPAGAGFGGGFGETTCFTQGRTPTRKIPIIFLMGRTDTSVGYSTMTGIRDAAIASYGATGPANVTMNAEYRHDRWTGAGVIETFDHAYETVDDGPWANANGHCIVGSPTDPYAPQYAIPCKLPNAFVWGEEVMRFFRAHRLP